MNKPKKEGTFVSAFIKKDAYDLLVQHCEKTGQSKTKALERAIENYCGDSDEHVDDDNKDDE